MASTARIAATTGSDNTTWTGKSVAAGATATFASSGRMLDGESIVFEKPNGAGNAWEPITDIDGAGNPRVAEITRQTRTITLNGPLDYRAAKSATANAVELTEYT